MLEGTDARIHYVYYTPEIEGARNRGGLRTNSFIQLRKSTADSRPMLEIDDMGDSEALLHDKRQLRQVGQRLIRRGIMPEDDGLERMARSVSKGASGRRDHPRNSKRNESNRSAARIGILAANATVDLSGFARQIRLG